MGVNIFTPKAILPRENRQVLINQCIYVAALLLLGSLKFDMMLLGCSPEIRMYVSFRFLVGISTRI